MNSSKFVKNGDQNRSRSRLVKAMKGWDKALESYDIKPSGVFGSRATIICGDVTIKSTEIDVEFSVPFDDDMEANEASITVYNLTDETIGKFTKGSQLSIEAGYENDTGLIFKGFVSKVHTKHDGADKITEITCFDDISKKTIEEKTYAKGTKASYILKDLISRTWLPNPVFKVRRDWTYKDEEKVDGDLMENIKKYSEVCGVSTTIINGNVVSRYIKEYDETDFIISSDTGMIGSPSPFTEEITAEDYKETINGYEVEMILQHRMTTGSGVTLKSRSVNGHFRVCSGEHTFSPDECTTKVKMY